MLSHEKCKTSLYPNYLLQFFIATTDLKSLITMVKN